MVALADPGIAQETALEIDPEIVQGNDQGTDQLVASLASYYSPGNFDRRVETRVVLVEMEIDCSSKNPPFLTLSS